jgi:hypothetical protein
MQDALDVASSPAELSSLCRAADRPPDPEQLLQRRRAFDAYLGPLDGRATERALREIRDLVEEASRQRAALRAERVSDSERKRRGPPVEPPSA